jgi:hypothetical protein
MFSECSQRAAADAEQMLHQAMQFRYLLSPIGTGSGPQIGTGARMTWISSAWASERSHLTRNRSFLNEYKVSISTNDMPTLIEMSGPLPSNNSIMVLRCRFLGRRPGKQGIDDASLRCLEQVHGRLQKAEEIQFAAVSLHETLRF